MYRMIRIAILTLAAALLLTACDFAGDQADPAPELPAGDPWPSDVEVTEGGEVPVYVMIDFSVDRGFGSGLIHVDVDGEPVVSGLGRHRPAEHCNWYGPYVLTLAPGSHRVNVELSADTLDELLHLDETFIVRGESTLFVLYLDPSYDSELATGRLTSYTHDGLPGCA